jgi:hypothetical protein
VPNFRYRKDNKGETVISITYYSGELYGFEEFQNIVNNTYDASVADERELKTAKKTYA